MMMSVPRSVGLFLSRAIARVRRLTLLRGCALVGIVWTLCVVAVMAVDSSIVIFDDRVRFAMAAGIALLTLLTALLAVVRPLRRRADFGKMARTLDARHPELEERFSTLVELAAADADRIGFSRALYSMIGDLAERDVAKLDLRREFSAARTLRWLAACLLFLLTLAAGIAVRPDPIGRLFVRAIAPWADIGNLFSKEISVRPGDVVALSGTVIRIEAARTKGVSREAKDGGFSIRISRKTPYGWSEETSEPMANGVYETTADLNEREWRYRVTAGRAVTKYHHVRVSEMPKYDLFTARVTYPSYTGWRPLVLTNAEVGAITAIQGSKVRFDVRASDPGTFCDFRIGKVPAFEHTMVSNKTTNWSLELVNRDGFRASKGKHPLTSFVDQPPSVVLEKPTGTLRLPPHAKIPVEITGSDDVAITSAYLRVSIDGEPWARHFGTRIDLPDDPRFLRTVADVDLSLYNLVFARNIRFDVVVEDACPPEFGGPHSATSMPFTVQFAENEANYEMQELKNTVAEARRDIDEAKKRLNDAQNLARQVRDELRRNPKVQESTEQKNERLAHELTEAEKRIESLRDAFADDERLAPLTRPMDRLLDDTLKPTLEQVENAQFRERGERADEVDAAIPEMQKAVQELDELQGRLSERAAKVDAFEKAKDLAARQAALAKAAKDILEESPQDKAKVEAWKRLEEAALRKADELIRQNPLGDFDEAKRKMETAAREMAGRKATDAQALQELRNAANDEKRAEQMLKTPNPRWPGVNEAQRTAEDRLERADATDAVKAYQRQATAAAQVAQEAPKERQKAAAETAAAAQQAAQAALKRELEVREQMAKGEKSEADLQALDAALGEQLLKATAERAQAAEAAAEQAVAEARDAVGDAEQEDVDRLADAALEARREAVRAARAESELRGDEGRTESLRDLENALSAQATEAAAATELEQKINSLQQAAMDAFKRRDRNRGISQQREAAREQRRAADAGTDAEDAVAARREANAAQAAAQQAAESVGRLDNETSEGVLKAQEAAMEAERTAQAEAQMARALAKIAAAERELPAPSDAEPPAPSDAAPALQAAEAAAEILAREVNAQAASLGMSKPDLSEPVQSGNGQKDRENGPGGVNAEVNRLAKELARKDDVNFFQKLFARLGWFKIRGASRDGLSEHDLKDVPREYRDLVRRYFLKLAEENP